MLVKEFIERIGMPTPPGRIIAYIKDGLEEINMLSETHVDTTKIDIVKDQRLYPLPKDMVKMLDVRCKNHENTTDKYRSIPRSTFEPGIEDEDGK